MFRMFGKSVELIRYKVIWQEDEQEMQEGCISEQHKLEVEQSLTERGFAFTTEVIDQTANEWFNGLEFGSYDEALEVFNLGAEVNKQSLYESKCQELIAAQYPVAEENKVMREYLAYPDDTAKQQAFAAYNDFVEGCKQQAYAEVYGG